MTHFTQILRALSLVFTLSAACSFSGLAAELEKLASGTQDGVCYDLYGEFDKYVQGPDGWLHKTYKNLRAYAVDTDGTEADIFIPSRVYIKDWGNIDVTKIFDLGSNDAIRSITINADRAAIITRAFRNLPNLHTVSVKAVRSLQYRAFADCAALESVSLPTIKELPEDCFANCPNLNNVDIPQVQSIAAGAFDYCPNLKNLDMPQVRSISDCAFRRSGLTDFIVTDNLQDVSESSFYYVTSIKNIYITSEDLSNLNDDISFPEAQDGVTVWYLPTAEKSVCDRFKFGDVNATFKVAQIDYLNKEVVCSTPHASGYGTAISTDPDVWTPFVTWKSSNPMVASFSTNSGFENFVSAFSAGTTVLTASLGESRKTCTWTVVEPQEPLTADEFCLIYYPWANDMGEVGQEYSAVEGSIPFSNFTIQIESSNPSVVEPNEDSQSLLCKAEGDAKITVRALIPAKKLVLEISYNFKVVKDMSGIDNITVENGNSDSDAPVEVYTLQGTFAGNSVDGLVPGFYIVRQGATAKKVLVK